MSVDSILSLVGMLFAVLGVLAALISSAWSGADVLVPFCVFVLLVWQMVRLVCYRETDALAPMATAGFAVIIWLVALTRRNGGS